jgi:hypothetical protein
VYRLFSAGKLFSVKSGGRRLVPEVALEQFIADLIRDAS